MAGGERAPRTTTRALATSVSATKSVGARSWPKERSLAPTRAFPRRRYGPDERIREGGPSQPCAALHHSRVVTVAEIRSDNNLVYFVRTRQSILSSSLTVPLEPMAIKRGCRL